MEVWRERGEERAEVCVPSDVFVEEEERGEREREVGLYK